MNNVLIVFSSATTANRVKNAIKKSMNINSQIVQTPAALRLKSCGFSLIVNGSDSEKVWDFVQKSGLSTAGVFRISDLSRIK